MDKRNVILIILFIITVILLLEVLNIIDLIPNPEDHYYATLHEPIGGA